MPASLLPDRGHMRPVLTHGRPPFAAGGARLGRRKLVCGAFGVRCLSALARRLPPVRGIESPKAPTLLVAHGSLPNDHPKGLSGWQLTRRALALLDFEFRPPVHRAPLRIVPPPPRVGRNGPGFPIADGL
jgi:hypothetical protein